MHAKSSALKDPIHAALYKKLMGDPTQEGVKHKTSGKYPVCLQCHAPIAARDGKTKLDALPAYGEGVTCVSCHTTTSFLGIKKPKGKLRLGTQAYTFSDTALQGGNGAWHGPNPTLSPGADRQSPISNPFPHAANPALFKSSDMCLGCHQQKNNPHGVAVCNIGTILTGKGAVSTCQSCHMPVVNGLTNHASAGGHDAAMLRRGVILTLTASPGKKGVQARVVLQNKLAHTFPTGAPFRNLILKVTALDAAGQVIWSNFETNPMTEDPQAIMMLQLVNKKGKPVLPIQATKVGKDSRLQPGETRTITYTIPVQGVAIVRAELNYHLLNTLLLELFGDQIPNTAKGHTQIGRAEAKL